MAVTVFKVGGSLLTLPDLASRLRAVLRQRAATNLVLVVGGGATADLVREWDRVHQLGQEDAHCLAMRSLTLNEALLRRLLPEARLITSSTQAPELWHSGKLPIVSADDYLRQAETRASAPLPHCWDVTSDSIAAWIAREWPADELVLLKSVPIPDATTPSDAVRSNWIDPHFPQLIDHSFAVSWANLRDAEATIRTWLDRSPGSRVEE